jgi:hypothetical protein
MARNAFRQAYAERQTHGTAWHAGAHTKRLEGTKGTALEALEIAGMNYDVVTLPSEYTLNGKHYVSTKHSIIVRPPHFGDETEPVEIAPASSGFTPVTNYEICEMLQSLTDGTEANWYVETIGALTPTGSDMFITLYAGNYKVGKDEVVQYFFVWNSNDGSNSLKVMVTPVRVVCQNTCILGTDQANIRIDVRHTRMVKVHAKAAIELVAQLRHAQEKTIEVLQTLPKIHVTQDQFSRIMTVAFPDIDVSGAIDADDALALAATRGTDKATHSDAEIAKTLGKTIDEERAREKAMRLRLLAWQALEEMNEADPKHANSGWFAYNAATQVANWAEGDDKTWAQQVMVGKRAGQMARAFDEIVALA